MRSDFSLNNIMFDPRNPTERFRALDRISDEHPFRIIPVSVENVLRRQEVRQQRWWWRQKSPPDDPDGFLANSSFTHQL